MSVRVERVVDIVQQVFKMSSAMSMFEDSPVTEMPFNQMSQIMTNLLMGAKIEYQ
jgi:hypothetical protein